MRGFQEISPFYLKQNTLRLSRELCSYSLDLASSAFHFSENRSELFSGGQSTALCLIQSGVICATDGFDVDRGHGGRCFVPRATEKLASEPGVVRVWL